MEMMMVEMKVVKKVDSMAGKKVEKRVVMMVGRKVVGKADKLVD